jgi:hypothetical protein
MGNKSVRIATALAASAIVLLLSSGAQPQNPQAERGRLLRFGDTADCRPDAVQDRLCPEWLLDEIEGTGVHRANRKRYIGHAR